MTTMEQLEEIKELIQIKKKPNRKLFPKENAVYSKIHTEVYYADEITWGILSYVPWQYEK